MNCGVLSVHVFCGQVKELVKKYNYMGLFNNGLGRNKFETVAVWVKRKAEEDVKGS